MIHPVSYSWFLKKYLRFYYLYLSSQFLFLLQTNYILYSFQDAILPIIAATYDLEDECLAGSESSEDGIIRKSPLPQPDKMIADRWKCLRCGILNAPPMRFCHKCYEVLISIFSF